MTWCIDADDVDDVDDADDADDVNDVVEKCNVLENVNDVCDVWCGEVDVDDGYQWSWCRCCRLCM